MLRNITELQGYKIQAKDDEIGKVHDFYFDDQSWTIRYLIVDTGGWLPGRRVLLSPASLGEPDWDSRRFPVALTKQQIEDSPSVEKDRPISRQLEERVIEYYGWPMYWAGSGVMAPHAVLPNREMARHEAPKEITEREEMEGVPHLRSAREVTGYHIQATDDEIGHVEDFIVADDVWMIRYMVVDTRNWLPGRKVLVSPEWIRVIKWSDSRVYVDLTQEQVEKSPEYNPDEPVNQEYETVLYDYYGRPKYWLKQSK